MNCRDAAERITALVDGELPPAEREELERHLSGCAACREARAAEESLAARLRAVPRPALPEGFAASVMAKVAAEKPRGRVIPLWPLVAAAAAVAAAVVAMVAVGPGAPRAGLEVANKPALPARPSASPDTMGRMKDAEEARAPEGSAAGPQAQPPAAVMTPIPPPPAEAAKPAGEGAFDEEKQGDRKAAKAEAPAPDPKADEDTVGATAAVAAEDGLKKNVEAPAATRLSLLYRVPVVVDAQRSVDGLLMANRALASRGGPWRAVDVDEKSGFAHRRAEGKDAATEGRILVLRVRPENLDKLRAALDKAAGVKASSVDLLDRGEVLPPEVGRLLGVRGGGGVPPAAPKAKSLPGPAPLPAPAPAPSKEPAPGDDAGAGPPPKPSAEQLRKLADAPPESKEGPTVETGTPSAEILVEVRIEVQAPAGGK